MSNLQTFIYLNSTKIFSVFFGWIPNNPPVCTKKLKWLQTWKTAHSTVVKRFDGTKSHVKHLTGTVVKSLISTSVFWVSTRHLQFKVNRLQIILVVKKYISTCFSKFFNDKTHLGPVFRTKCIVIVIKSCIFILIHHVFHFSVFNI